MRRMKNIFQNYLISVILRLDRRIHVLSLWIARSSRAMMLLSMGFFISFGLLVGCATMSPLTKAAGDGDINTVKKLLDEGADKDYDGALLSAAYKGHTEIARLLIEKGADVNAIIHNTRVLAYAALTGHTKTAQLLVEKGADIDMALVSCEEWNRIGIRNIYARCVGELNRFKAERDRIAQQKEKEQEIARTKEIEMQKAREMKEIIKEVVKESSMQKTDSKAAPSIQSDIDNPSFNQSERIMKENDLAVIIGIEGYQGLPKSDYSYDDAKLVGDYVKALGFKPRNIELLLDERATKSAIEKIIKTWLPNRAKPESRVFVYYSGHGAPEPKTGDAYIVPFDGDPNYLSDTGYPLKSLYNTLAKLQVAEVTVILDSCFSGGGGRSVIAKGARPLVMMTTSAVLPSNIVVLSATLGTQISTSSPEKGHGIFTYYFLKALKDGKKTVAEIYEYIKPLVEDEAKQLNVQQSPSISPDVEKLRGRFELRK